MQGFPMLMGGGSGEASASGLSAAMPWIGLGLQALGGMQSNAANERTNSINIAHQDMWRNTAYQAATADMKKAGINPMISAMSGGGAQVPGGSSAQQQNAMEGMAASAMQAMKMKQELEYMDAQTQKTREEAETQEATQGKIGVDTAFTEGLIGKTPKEIREIETRIKDTEKGWPTKDLTNKAAKDMSKGYDQYNKNIKNTQQWLDTGWEAAKSWIKDLSQSNVEKKQWDKSQAVIKRQRTDIARKKFKKSVTDKINNFIGE